MKTPKKIYLKALQMSQIFHDKFLSLSLSSILFTYQCLLFFYESLCVMLHWVINIIVYHFHQSTRYIG